MCAICSVKLIASSSCDSYSANCAASSRKKAGPRSPDSFPFHPCTESKAFDSTHLDAESSETGKCEDNGRQAGAEQVWHSYYCELVSFVWVSDSLRFIQLARLHYANKCYISWNLKDQVLLEDFEILIKNWWLEKNKLFARGEFGTKAQKQLIGVRHVISEDKKYFYINSWNFHRWH